ncbi:MAG: lysine--tRNA ligase, partial [Desulfovibrio sp.]|nr:lysine--tRNA ligase [Desulfovibrio sp.]
MPMLESFASHDELNEVAKNRVSKACDLLDAGVPLFPNTFRKKHLIAWIHETYGEKDETALESCEPVEGVTGRIVALRSFGKAAFLTIRDQSGHVQCHVSKDVLGEETYKIVKKLDVGDIVGVSGKLFRTKTDELTIACATLMLITRSMRSLPEKYHGLKDMETRYRQRYVDLIVTPRTREIFEKRSLIVR